MAYMEIFRDLRQDRGLTQSQIAQVLKTSQQYYGKYENGKRPLPVDHLITLCKFYKVSADWVLGLKDKR